MVLSTDTPSKAGRPTSAIPRLLAVCRRMWAHCVHPLAGMQGQASGTFPGQVRMLVVALASAYVIDLHDGAGLR